MFRYLLRIAYIGAPFRGSQRQVIGLFPRSDDPSTVQGRLEMALQLLNPCNEVVVAMASRTDKDVNAINAACHVDLHRQSGLAYEPKSITFCLNKYFNKRDVPIRIVNSYIVPDDFHCRRNITSRSYLYRIIVAKSETLNVAPHTHYFPIEEIGRSLCFCTNTFDVDAMREAALLFHGLHDFRTFKSTPHEKFKKDKYSNTQKYLEEIRIVENSRWGYSPYSWPTNTTNDLEEYKFIDIYVTGKGFLYKQVRRTVASLIAVAQGKVNLRDIKLMLQVPSKHSWCDQIKTVPGNGLYLCDINYSQSDQQRFTS